MAKLFLAWCLLVLSSCGCVSAHEFAKCEVERDLMAQNLERTLAECSSLWAGYQDLMHELGECEGRPAQDEAGN